MLKINTELSTIASSLIDDLAHVDFPTFGHFLEEGFLDPDLRRIVGSTRLIGRAVTVRITGQDSTLVHYVTSMLAPGDVLVVDTGGDRKHAPVGGVIINAIAKSGAAGLVIDGPCTDRNTLLEKGLPVYARGTSILTTKLLGLDAGGINVPVSVGGVAVLPGYVVFGDENGVFAGDPVDVAATLAAVQKSDRDEPPMLERLWAGESLPVMTGAAGMVDRVRGVAPDDEI
jgi:regulator of RNase E activity RraA